MTKIKIDLFHAREKVFDRFHKDFDDSNKLWYGTIRVVITLSSSFLLLTLAVAKNLFPEVNNFNEFSYYLITAWVTLFFAIIFGIIAEIDAAIFHGNSGRDAGDTLREIDTKLSEGLTEEIVNIPESYFKNANIFWGAASVDSFIVAIVCLCLSFLGELQFKYSLSTLFVCLLLLIALNVHLIKKRK